MGWMTLLSGLVKPVTDLVDGLHTSEEEKGKIRSAIMGVQVQFGMKLLEYEAKRMELQSKVIEAEAKSDSAITRSWRPITMLVFVGMLVSYWLGYTPENIDKEQVEWLLDVIKLGLGGYVIGRSAEKVVPQVARIFKKDA